MNRILFASVASLAVLAGTTGHALAGSWSGGLGMNLGINLSCNGWCSKGGSCKSGQCGYPGMGAPVYGPEMGAMPHGGPQLAYGNPGYGYQAPSVVAYQNPGTFGYFPAMTAPNYGYNPAAVAYGAYNPYAYQAWGYGYPAQNFAPAANLNVLTAAHK